MALQKGQSGNPTGKRNERLWRDAIITAAKASDNEGDLKLALKRLAAKLISNADEGDMLALKEIGNRLDGAPDVNVEYSGSITHDHEGIPVSLGWLGEIRGASKISETKEPVLN